MKKIIASLLLLISGMPCARSEDNASLVDPFIGVDASGNTFPGAALPFSMVKLGPDMYLTGRWTTTNSGYRSGAPVYGFSHTHVSGTGGGAKYGHFPVMPFKGDHNRRDFSSRISHESASPGYYSGILESGIKAEMTLTPSVGFHRYTSMDGSPLKLFFDISALLDKGSTPQHALDSGVEVESPTEVSGYLNSEGGWNVGAPYKVYFYAVLSSPARNYGTFREGRCAEGNGREWSLNRNDHTRKALYLDLGDAACVDLKVAISYRSIQDARENYRREASAVSFDEARTRARKAWNEYLDRLELKASDEVKTLVYSGLYRSLLMPVVRAGQMRQDDYYAIWDTFRTVSPLLAIVAPEAVAAQINSMIDIASEEGFLLDARSGNCSGLVQGGSNADMLIADAISKNIGGVDYARALDLMIRGAECEPDNPRKLGRGGISLYNSLGYIPAEIERSCSRQVEYAACDHSIAVVSRSLGRDSVAAEFMERSRRWRNLWNPEAGDGEFKGFVVPRGSGGEWVDQDLLQLGSWTSPYYEGNAWQYSFYVPHDVPGLIEACGGKDEFVRRLDRFFDKGMEGDKHYYNVGNEPSFLTPYLYSWAGRPDKTAETVRRIREKYFRLGREGLPGNDDSGAMGSWAVFACLGFFPVAGSDLYVVGSPMVEEAVFHLSNGKDFKIRRGKKNKSLFFHHSDILRGGVMNISIDGK